MNKKGFTLAELMAVIIVIGIIALVSVPAVISSIKSNNVDSYNSLINDIVLSAETYASNAGGNLVQISVETLQNVGYLSRNLVNPIDNSSVNGCVYMAMGKGVYKEEECKTVITGLESDNICNYALGTSWPYEYSASDLYYTFNVPCSGNYKIELWGAQGGGTSAKPGGLGGYTSGIIDLKRNSNLYLYVGSEGGHNASVTNIGGYNGGGYSGNNNGSHSYGGGGATDVRLKSGNWNDFESLKSRIMVAAGGGGNTSTTSYTTVPGAAGGLIGYDAVGNWYQNNAPTGATQIEPGTSYGEADRIGAFGYARQSLTGGWGGGGGSGYFGGATGHGHAGAAGSSYISGHAGSLAITSTSTTNLIEQRTGATGGACSPGTSDIVCSYHYSDYIFHDTVMIDGAGYNWTTSKGAYVGQIQPNHTTVAGHNGNGYARITLISF